MDGGRRTTDYTSCSPTESDSGARARSSLEAWAINPATELGRKSGPTRSRGGVFRASARRASPTRLRRRLRGIFGRGPLISSLPSAGISCWPPSHAAHSGVVAPIGSTVILLATAIAEGLGAGLIRRPGLPAKWLRTPDGHPAHGADARRHLDRCGGGAVWLRRHVTALMVFAMPITSLQSGGRLALVRSLHFRRVVLVDTVGLAAFYLWGISWSSYSTWASGALRRPGSRVLSPGRSPLLLHPAAASTGQPWNG